MRGLGTQAFMPMGAPVVRPERVEGRGCGLVQLIQIS